jgi:hypothetical protein
MSNLRKQRIRNAQRNGLIMIVTACSIIIAATYFVFNIKLNTTERDAATNCRIDGHVAKETILILDATDPISSTQQILIDKEARKFFSNAITDERFSIYILDENHDRIAKTLSVCNPGDGSDKSALTSNKRRLKNRWEEGFYSRLISEVKKLNLTSSASKSPIMEIIKHSSIDAMYHSPAAKKKMIIISDLLQHTNVFSQYRTTQSFNEVYKNGLLRPLMPQLDGVEVEVLYLERPNSSLQQGRSHVRFWEQFVDKAGGELSRVKWVN